MDAVVNPVDDLIASFKAHTENPNHTISDVFMRKDMYKFIMNVSGFKTDRELIDAVRKKSAIFIPEFKIVILDY
jgi:hypothetical protein